MMQSAADLEVRLLTRVLKALGDETRLRIVALLAHGELCVCHLESALGLTQSNASRQLGLLRAADLVDARRDGTWVYYRLRAHDDELIRSLVDTMVQRFGAAAAIRRDLKLLQKVKGPGKCA
jgi:ArsR family transcriptional regulator, arsenate/arsenite/antimonite-responsive transcriptional repressor